MSKDSTGFSALRDTSPRARRTDRLSVVSLGAVAPGRPRAPGDRCAARATDDGMRRAWLFAAGCRPAGFEGTRLVAGRSSSSDDCPRPGAVPGEDQTRLQVCRSRSERGPPHRQTGTNRDEENIKAEVVVRLDFASPHLDDQASRLHRGNLNRSCPGATAGRVHGFLQARFGSLSEEPLKYIQRGAHEAVQGRSILPNTCSALKVSGQ